MKFQLDIIRHDKDNARQTLGIFEGDALPRIRDIVQVTVTLSGITLVSQDLRVALVEHWLSAPAGVDVRIGVVCELPEKLNVLSSVH